jgi:hypothetical protein
MQAPPSPTRQVIWRVFLVGFPRGDPKAAKIMAVASRHSGSQLLGKGRGDLRFDITHQQIDSFLPNSN